MKLKKWFIAAVLITTFTSADEHPLSNPFPKLVMVSKKVDFRIAFGELKEFEGNYSFAMNDKGGETYGGIARNFHKKWPGWAYVDGYKGRLNCLDTTHIHKAKCYKLRWNQEVPEVKYHLTDFYVTIWLNEGFDQLTNQNIANYVFEFRINGVGSARIIRQVLKDMDQDIEINRIMEPKVIEAINNVDSEKFIFNLKKARTKYYYNIVKRDPTQKEFLSHWIKRANKIS